MTFDNIERKARRILQDDQGAAENYRWSSSEMRDHLQEGIYSLHAIRPETRYVNGVLCDAVIIPTAEDEAQDFPVDARFEEALVYFVVHKCYLDDDPDIANGRLAELYLGKFNTKAQL